MPDVRLIDANATKEKLCLAIEPFIGSAADEIRNDTLLKAAAIVDSMPTVKHGKWIETHCDLICGVCKWEYSDELPYMSRNGCDSYYEAFAFCPHCGSRLSPPDGAMSGSSIMMFEREAKDTALEFNRQFSDIKKLKNL